MRICIEVSAENGMEERGYLSVAVLDSTPRRGHQGNRFAEYIFALMGLGGIAFADALRARASANTLAITALGEHMDLTSRLATNLAT